MTRRRSVLVLGLGGLMLSAISRVAVAGPTQIEADGYAGSSVGQWTCGPTARARYGGVGGHVRVYTDDQPAAALAPLPEEAPNGGALDADVEGARPTAQSPLPPGAEREPAEPPRVIEPMGLSLEAGGAGEHRSFTRIACNEVPCSPKNDAIPPGQLLGAGHAGLGYDWKYFGLRFGALAFQRWSNGFDASPAVSVLPDIEFRFARRAGFHAGVGFGAYDASTTFRPGGYHFLGYTGGDWDVDLRVGGHLVFDDEVGLRFAGAVRYAVTRGVAPGIGVAVSSTQQVSPEGRLFVVFTP